MGILEELLRQLAEAAEEQNRTTLPGTPPAKVPPTAREPATAPDQATARHQSMAQAQSRPKSPPKRQAPVVREADDPGESNTVRQLAETAPALVIYRGEQHPILSRFRQPGGARDAVVLAEIMAPRGRWRRR